MIFNIQRPDYSEVVESVLLREFTHPFRCDLWTGERLPEVFYDLRSQQYRTHLTSYEVLN
ncbi:MULTISPECIES: hypothetical protein [unclassified Nostoc]|uniref:hypothetical protein n=1 Tax=unclassified Nostoc TaxID=2593658 RepID=UPI001A7E5A07|nr:MULTISPECIES: hypothetical protein [unclassified Nostoc]